MASPESVQVVVNNGAETPLDAKHLRNQRQVPGKNVDFQEPRPKQSKTGVYIIVAALVIFHLVAGMAIGMYFAVTADRSQSDSPEEVDMVTVAEMNGEIILHTDYIQELADPGSQMYKDYSMWFCAEMDNVISGTEMFIYYTGCTVNRFRPGSVIVDYTIKFMPQTEKQKKEVQHINSRIIKAVQNNEFMEGIDVSMEAVPVLILASVETQMVETCDSDYNGGCSHNCNMMNDIISCSCREGHELFHNSEKVCTDVDECTSETHKCEHSGRCVNTIGSYSCDCNNTGYTGEFCQENINECLLDDTCHNGGSCTDTPGHYKCTCTEGFTDQHCETEFGLCDMTDDLCNEGTCVNTQGSYQCVCPEDYTGDNCESEVTVIAGTMSVVNLDSVYNETEEPERIANWTCTLIELLMKDEFSYEFCSVSSVRVIHDFDLSGVYFNRIFYEVDFQVHFSEHLNKIDLVTQAVLDYLRTYTETDVIMMDLFIQGIHWCDTTLNSCGMSGCNRTINNFAVTCICEDAETWNNHTETCFQGLEIIPDVQHVTVQTGLAWYGLGCQIHPPDVDMLADSSWLDTNGDIVPLIDISETGVSTQRLVSYMTYFPGIGHVHMLQIANTSEKDTGHYTCRLNTAGLPTQNTGIYLELHDCSAELEYHLCGDAMTCFSTNQRCDGVIDCRSLEFYVEDAKDEEHCYLTTTPSPSDVNTTAPPSGCPVFRTECPGNPEFCVRKIDICDGNPDCPNATDEMNCESDCEGFLCPVSGLCIINFRTCDGTCHCGESCEDEVDNDCICPEGDFTCDGRCLQTSTESVYCNGVAECEDGTDEPPDCTCMESQFSCYFKGYEQTQCVSKDKICDRNKDCENSRDEKDCNCYKPFVECPDNEYSCIFEYDICDGHEDCSDKSDERNCGEDCRGFLCREDNLCIPSSHRCSGLCDCSNCTDEYDNCSCRVYQFQCDDGMCLDASPDDVFCNGQAECQDGSDEPPDCECLPNQFDCMNEEGPKHCISKSRVCDETTQCESELDEKDCACLDAKEQCLNGECKLKHEFCDGDPDCTDGSDEIGCEANCSTGYKNCPTYAGICRPESEFCDDVDDCPEGLDEVGCPCTGLICSTGGCVRKAQLCNGVCDCETCEDELSDCQCPPYFYQCDNGMCTYKEEPFVHCNGIQDCYDGSDESDDCTCLSTQITCASGDQCVPFFVRCDGHPNCTDSSDEWDCSCSVNEFQCDRLCKDVMHWCDGKQDCTDGSDEENCDNSQCHPEVQFECPDGLCLAQSDLCDGYSNCGDFSDERNCNKSCQDGYVPCPEYKNRCIMTSWICDGSDDCPEGLDEEGCPCGETELDCDGGCTSLSGWCDRYPDCDDGADEPPDCPPCHPEKQFDCGNGSQCVSNSSVCDGYFHCENQNDEHNCECSDAEFECDGFCQSLSKWCDNITDCEDGSDEANCDINPCHPEKQSSCGLNSTRCIREVDLCDWYIDCPDGRDEKNCTQTCAGGYDFRCADGSKCIHYSRTCNYRFDCADESDEYNCDCGIYDYTCSDGRCIHEDMVCNGYEDCSSGEDEVGCRCQNGAVPCQSANSTCVEYDMFCDGHWDCPMGEDEQDCVYGCMSPNVRCKNNHCVHYSKVCDGINNCPDGEDEENCACVSPSLQCGDNECVGESSICDGREDCSDGADEDNCDCGKRSENIERRPSPYIIRGSAARPGDWPWQVQVRLIDNYFICGGVILNEDWIITAAHCIRLDLPSTYTVVVGATKLHGYEEQAVEKSVTHIITHPNYTSDELVDDLALMKVSGKIEMSDYIKPICLPELGQQHNSQHVCFATGWGTVDPSQIVTPRSLEEVRMKIWDEGVKACRFMDPDYWDSIFEYYYDYDPELRLPDHNNTICTGYASGTGGCYGDSGGPLVCLDQANTWHLAGVTSFGEYCKGYSYYMRVSYYVDWIHQTMHEYSDATEK